MYGFIISDKCLGMLESIAEVFPDGQSVLMLVCARLRHVAATGWSLKRYLNMEHLFEQELQQQLEMKQATG